MPCMRCKIAIGDGFGIKSKICREDTAFLDFFNYVFIIVYIDYYLNCEESL
jgi:hypothetical protein